MTQYERFVDGIKSQVAGKKRSGNSHISAVSKTSVTFRDRASEDEQEICWRISIVRITAVNMWQI